MKRLTVVFSVAFGLFAGGGSASADSLVYLDGDGDLSAARPDGSGTRKLVSNDANLRAVSVDGSGRIAYFAKVEDGDPFHYLIDKEGKRLAGPYLFGDMGLCGGASPFRSDFSPDGTWIAASYIRGTTSCGSPDFTIRTRIVDSDGPTLDGSIYGEHSNLLEPRFLPRQQPLLSGISGNLIQVWQSPSEPTMTPWILLNDPAWEIDSFDYHPDENLMIMEQSPAGFPDGGERRDILLLEYEAPGSPNLAGICTYDGLVAQSEQLARPRYSPDGSKIAWSGPAGIFVSPAPTNNGGTCSLSPKLTIPGGKEVEWAPFELASAPGPGGKLQIAGVNGTSRVGFRNGATVRVRVPAAGLVRVTATVPKGVARRLKLAKRPTRAIKVAGGQRRAGKAGTVSIKLKTSAKAKAKWRLLAGVRVTIKAVQGTRSGTRTVKLTR
ncbi:MAG: WD40 repeat domain-containing protein [Solirubrobacterales bacterium]|nr:WD40 repeat domain-containing protein [Solirubrobacterales bacterium]